MRYAVCVNNRNYSGSLEVRKLYCVLRDPHAAEKGLLRVIDDSGEDYLYPQNYFVPISVPESVARVLEVVS
jgi:hypothetical protein